MEQLAQQPVQQLDSTPLPWQQQQWRRVLQQRQSGRIPHAYLLAGERGLGKKHFARLFAELLLCESNTGQQACGKCRSCQLLASASNPDLMVVAPQDSQVIKIGQVRELAEFAVKTSHSNARKVVILLQAEALNINAANALLKTLEEPPGDTVLLLVSDSPGKLLPTIRSRCQKILFTAPEPGVAEAWLAEVARKQEPGPETGQDEMHEALALADNRPLLALELLDIDKRTERRNVLKALLAMVEGRLDPVEFSASGKSIGAENVMEWLWQATSILLKQLLGRDAFDPGSREIDAIYRKLTSAGRSEDEILTRLVGINQAAEDARRQLTSTSNPNPQLVLEAILWRWSRLAS